MPPSPHAPEPVAGTVVLKPGREKPVRQRHPWVFSGAIQRLDGDPPPGALVDVTSAEGNFLARGYVNTRSQITVRLLSWQADEAIDAAFWRARLQRAVAARAGLASAAAPSALRLVNAESDGLPGLVVDRYDRWLVVQAQTAGIAGRLPALSPLLMELGGGPAPVAGVFERSDGDARGREGLPMAVGVLAGEPPPEEIQISEPAADGRPLRFLVDVRRGHKTGFYLDQRENRREVAGLLAGRELLNVFSYTGGFAVHALAAGAARVLNLDASAPALALARRNLALNDLPQGEDDFLVGDAFQTLRDLRAAGARFDAVILDPPKLAQRAGDVQRATRGYKDLNLSALRLLRPGGLLATFSCSGLISADLFQKVVFGAALDAGRDVAIIGRFAQPADHPVALTFPEAEYLKGLLCQAW